MNKLKILLVDYGLGKYYTYTDEQGNRHPVIEMNKDMLYFDEKLFLWVFQHELEHYKFYQNKKNWGKPNSKTKEVIRLLTSPRMFIKLNKFERTYPKCYESKFSYGGKIK